MSEIDEDTNDTIDIYLGDEFPVSRSHSVSSLLDTKLVIIIGPIEAGKTTFLSKIFDKFQDGPIDHWSFVSSETIVGYEKILRTYRSSNVAGRPAVDRTLLSSDPDLLHLILKKISDEPVGLLMANLSGEVFTDLIQAEDAVENMKYLRSADHISIVIDGAKILNKAQRSFEIGNTYTFLEKLAKSGYLTEEVKISLLISKSDIFKTAPGGEQFISETMEKISSEIIEPLKKLGVDIYNKPVELISEPLSQCIGFADVLNLWTDKALTTTLKAVINVKSNRLADHYKAGLK